MYKSLHLAPYRNVSESATALAQSLNIKMIRPDPEKSTFKGSKEKLVINWGTSGEAFPNPEADKCTVINRPSVVARASNKLKFFQVCSDATDGKEQPRVPRWTTNKEEALTWIKNDCRAVFARTVLNGNSGQGIIEIETEEDLQGIKEGTLLVEYVPKKVEYRIHVCDGEVFDIQRKALKEGNRKAEGNNWRVRNLKNGFIFARNDIGKVPDDVLNQAVLAVNKVGLDFGACDIIWNAHRKGAYVLEINTAPGLEGTTLENYTEVFLRKFKGKVE